MIKISTIENVCYAPNKNDNFFIKIENACYKKVGVEKMPIISMKNLYRNAMRESYILGAFNVFNCDTLKAVLDVAQSVQSPVIVQISMGARKYIGNYRNFIRYIHMMAEDYAIPISVNHNHCSSVEAAMEAVDAGVNGVMFDGSGLPFDENVEKTGQVAAYAKL